VALPLVLRRGASKGPLTQEDTEGGFNCPVEDIQKIVDANEKLVKELKDGANAIS
jgi:hypothetical protein